MFETLRRLSAGGGLAAAAAAAAAAHAAGAAGAAGTAAANKSEAVAGATELARLAGDDAMMREIDAMDHEDNGDAKSKARKRGAKSSKRKLAGNQEGGGEAAGDGAAGEEGGDGGGVGEAGKLEDSGPEPAAAARNKAGGKAGSKGRGGLKGSGEAARPSRPARPAKTRVSLIERSRASRTKDFISRLTLLEHAREKEEAAAADAAAAAAAVSAGATGAAAAAGGPATIGGVADGAGAPSADGPGAILSAIERERAHKSKAGLQILMSVTEEGNELVRRIERLKRETEGLIAQQTQLCKRLEAVRRELHAASRACSGVVIAKRHINSGDAFATRRDQLLLRINEMLRKDGEVKARIDDMRRALLDYAALQRELEAEGESLAEQRAVALEHAEASRAREAALRAELRHVVDESEASTGKLRDEWHALSVFVDARSERERVQLWNEKREQEALIEEQEVKARDMEQMHQKAILNALAPSARKKWGIDFGADSAGGPGAGEESAMPLAGAMSIRQESAVKGKLLHGRWQAAHAAAVALAFEGKQADLEDGFAAIREHTGIEDADELVDKFLSNEDQVFRLFSHVNLLGEQIEELETAIAAEKDEIERFISKEGSETNLGRSISTQLSERLQHLSGRTARLVEAGQQAARIVDQVKNPVASLFIRIGCDTKLIASVVVKDRDIGSSARDLRETSRRASVGASSGATAAAASPGSPTTSAAGPGSATHTAAASPSSLLKPGQLGGAKSATLTVVDFMNQLKDKLPEEDAAQLQPHKQSLPPQQQQQQQQQHPKEQHAVVSAGAGAVANPAGGAGANASGGGLAKRSPKAPAGLRGKRFTKGSKGDDAAGYEAPEDGEDLLNKLRGLEITENNVLQYFGVVEQRVTELLMLYNILAKQKPVSMVNSKGLAKAVRPDLPSTEADHEDYDDDVDENGELRPLSYRELLARVARTNAAARGAHDDF